MNLLDQLAHIQRMSAPQNDHVAAWIHQVNGCTTKDEFFAVMRSIRVTQPTEDELVSLYLVAGPKLATLREDARQL